jgi:hypothetical protein
MNHVCIEQPCSVCGQIDIITFVDYMHLAHTTHPNVLRHLLPPTPRRSLSHNDLGMCRVVMAWFHGVTDTDVLLSAAID